jgi:hypothetical protein
MAVQGGPQRMALIGYFAQMRGVSSPSRKLSGTPKLTSNINYSICIVVL